MNKIGLNNDTGKIKVELQINSDFPIRTSSVAEIYAPSPIGGKQIAIIPSNDGKMAVEGDFLVSSSKLGLTDELAKQIEPLKDKIEKLLDIQWWNWEKEKINKEVPFLCSTQINDFVIKHYNKI